MTKTTLVLLVLLLAPLHAADPTTPVIWTAKQLADTETKIRGAVDPTRHLGDGVAAVGVLIKQ